jgi:hypothetical protein
MNHYIVAPAVFAVLAASCGTSDVFVDVSSKQATMGPASYEYGATTDGEYWAWEVSFADVKDSPDWAPGEDPSLPISEAIHLAEGEVEKYTATPRAYQLDKVEWLHIGNHVNDGRKWIYLVAFERQYRFEGQEFIGRGTLTIPVLLDGRVITGRKK